MDELTQAGKKMFTTAGMRQEGTFCVNDGVTVYGVLLLVTPQSEREEGADNE